MNKIKLPSMVEYVFEIGVPGTTDKQFTDSVMLFANFLSQQPNIGMFVPAVFENGELIVLEEPIARCLDYKNLTTDEFILLQEEYHTALDNVIFEGFEYDGSEDGFVHIKNNETLLVFDAENKELVLYNSENNYTTEIKTIEDLIPYSLTLTPKFAKELGLI
jgi:hypothetical protein